MENTIYLGLSRQMTLQTNMGIVANNIANMNTTGYRGQNLIFSEAVSDPRGADDALSFVYDKREYENTQAGSVKFTGNPFNVAVDGPGFIGVVGPGGEPHFTRAGNFQKDEGGILRTAAGFPVSSQGGGEIIIPQDAKEVNIDDNGFVSDENGVIGQIQVSEFENPQLLEAIGNGLYKTSEAGAAAENSRLRQGHLEGSNVNGVVEMTRMIDTLRSFQSVQNVLQAENERLRTAIEKLTGQ